MTDDAIHIRIASSLKKQIQDLVEAGEYRDMTDFVTKAIRNQLEDDSCERYDEIKEMIASALREKNDDLILDAIFQMLLENLKEPLLETLADNDVMKVIREIAVSPTGETPSS